MQDIIHAFGIDVRLIAIQILNFSVLLVALWYFLYTPVLSLIEKRRRAIEQGVADALEAARNKAQALEEKAALMTEAHKEAEAVTGRAKEHAQKLAKEHEHAALLKGERMLEDAQKEAEALKERMKKESEADIARVAILAAEKILTDRS